MPEVGATGQDDFVARDLDATTWPDFERFFSRYDGVQDGCWCMYYHRTGETPGKTRDERVRKNHDDKKSMVMANKSRAVLIYHGNEVVASCQYGTREELPRIDNGRYYKALGLSRPVERFWRITCFFVDKSYRRRGITRLALKEVLSRIRELGGGIVEAYPVTDFRTVTVWFGTVNTFRSQGFEFISELGKSRVVMRKLV